jgi:DUF917 family protein
MWHVTEADLDAIAIGAGILGTGGGGNPYLGKLIVRELLRSGLAVPVLSENELPEDALVVSCGTMGAPTVGIEKLLNGQEFLHALRALEAHIGRTVTGVISSEMGGANSMTPMMLAAQAGLPVVDGDGMGRAFPELQMETFVIEGVSATPAAMCDDKNNVVVFDRLVDACTLERLARVVTIQMGGRAAVVSTLLSTADVRRTAILGTLSEARDIGRAVLAARRERQNPCDAIVAVRGGRRAFTGKISDVERRTEGGFARGRMVLDGLDDFRGRSMEIRFQNENLVAWLDGTLCISVPDLICLIDHDRGEPVPTEELRYGLRVHVLGLPAPAKLRTPAALAVVGPRYFGYDVDYEAIQL